ncbi:MAG: O-antigen ligase family protein [Halothiobacillus sp.]|jgi:O-antigen ligase|nr:O-antigen ligase family protein [Halothiobacillus sp.]
MRQRSITHAITLAFVLWFGSYAYLYFYPFTGFKPLYSYFLLLGYFAIWLGAVRKLKISRDQGSRALLAWLYLYLGYGCLALFNSTLDDVAVQAFIYLGEAILISAVFVLMFADQTLMRRIQAAFAMLAVIATALNVYDFLDPLFTNVPGRAAGLYVNANIAGHFIAMAMVAGVELIPRRWRLLFVLGCGVGVLLTFSRAAWILWGVAVLWLGWQGYIGLVRNRLFSMVLGAVIGIGFIGLVFTGGLGDYIAGGSFASHLDANTQARLGIGASSLSGHSAHLREALIFDSLRIGSEAPLVGHGLGHTAEWQFPVGPHNMYLLFFVEGGIPGLLLYLALMVLLWRYSAGVGKVVALQLIVAGIFTHNQLDQPAFLIMMAFVVAHHAVVRRAHGARVRNQAMVPA